MFRLNKFWQQPLPNSDEEDEKKTTNNFYLNGGMILVELIENEPLSIITGCFEGIIRIYCPHGREFVPHDLQLEKKLDQPILNIGFSDFLKTNEKVLAILHPNELCYYSIIVTKGLDIHGIQFDIQKITSLTLTSKAITFFYDNFFNSEKAIICIQLFNGNIIFIDGEQVLFEKNLPNALLYYPIKYIPYNDTFLINTLSFQLMCLKFISISEDKQQKPKSKKNIASLKHNTLEPQVLWTCLIGENISDVCVSKKYEKNQEGPKLIALGSTSLFFISHKGELLSSLKFDSPPTNFHLYPVYRDDQLLRENLIVVTLSNHLLIYSSHKLVWTAKLEKKIINIVVAKINNIPGMIITLNINGQLEVCYLGTNIYTTPIQQVELNKDYKEMENEMKELTETIEKYSKNEYIKKEKLYISMDINISNLLNISKNNIPENSISPAYVVEFLIKNTANFSIHNAKLFVSPVEPIMATKPCQIIETLPNGTTTMLVSFYVKEYMPCSLECQSSLIYSLPNSDEIKTVNCSFKLPIIICGELSSPSKENKFKLTIETNLPAVLLSDIYKDICPKDGVIPKYISKNIVGFRYWNKINATINGSTRRGRYRISSNFLEALYVLLIDFKQRLKDISSKHISNELDIKYQESFEFNDYIPYFDEIINNNEKLNKLNDDLINKTLQYKVIQKKLLLHYKDKIPTSLIGLRSLLDRTYASIHTISSDIINLKKENRISTYNFVVISHMILELWRMKDFSTKHKEDFELLCESFSPRLLLISEDNNDTYFQTIIDSINMMLRKDKKNVNTFNKRTLLIESLKSLNNYMNDKAFLFNENG
ncbi:PTHB1 N-terminus-domain-containing protein [Neocallimastix sp. 'constans']|jgi:Bardet-Biedl syndrome 9 protein